MAQLKYILPAGLITLIVILSCNEKLFTFDVDCEDCYTEKPDSVDLIIHWTKNDDFQEIPVLLYKGKIDVGEFIDTFFLFGNPAYIWVKSQEEYSIKALYETDERTTLVVDGTNQKIKRVSGYCDNDCWVIEDEVLHIELRY